LLEDARFRDLEHKATYFKVNQGLEVLSWEASPASSSEVSPCEQIFGSPRNLHQRAISWRILALAWPGLALSFGVTG
jgi:hypothetical protein